MESKEIDVADYESESVVIISGSHSSYSGLTGRDSPSITVPTTVTDSDNQKIKHPIQWGICFDVDDLHKIYSVIFDKELKIDPSECNLLTSFTIEHPKKTNENIVKMVFEQLQCPKFYIAKNAQCISYASGKATSLVIEIGHMVTRTIPLYEGYVLPHAVLRHDIAGQDINQYLFNLLNQKGYNLDINIINDIKHKACYTAMDYDKEQESNHKQSSDQ